MTTHKHITHGVVLVENDIKGFQTPMETEMQGSIKHFEVELAKIRTGKAHVSLVEDIMVNIYGQPATTLKKVASLAAPEARLITIQPWDKAIIHDIEKAITASELGVTPVSDGAMVRVQLPIPSSQRREELKKLLHKRGEEAKVAVRNVRKEYNNLIREGKADKKISENFYNRLSDLLDKVTKTFTDKIDLMVKNKEHDITSS